MPRYCTFLLLTTLFVASLVSSADGARRRKMVDRPADAVEVFACGFDVENWDVNYDGWPDRWNRKEGVEYPHYVDISIAEDALSSSGRRMLIKLDGAQAAVSSPPIHVLPKFSYYLELKVKIEDAPGSRVTVRFDYLNWQGEVRQTLRSEPVAATGEWVTLGMHAGRPQFDDIDRAIVRIETEKGQRGDLHGKVSIADIWLGRTPSMLVSANSEFHVYTDPRDVVIRCALSGIRERDPEIRFQLLDATSNALGKTGVEDLNGREIVEQNLIHEESRRASEIVDGFGNQSIGYEGETEWRPEIEKHGSYGFYQIVVRMISRETGEEIYDRTITLAVIPPPPPVTDATGEFGWTLPMADNPLDFATLEKLLPLVGVKWVKLPIWFPVEDQQRSEAILQFAERLSAKDIEMVGVIQHPDNLTVDLLEEDPTETKDIANVFSTDVSHWLPLFDHITSRLSLRIRWWQLGGDHDTSFVGYDDLVRQIRDIRQKLYRFGQDVGLGLGWRWDTAQLQGDVSWEFNQMAANPPLDSEQLEERFQATNRGTGKRWVLIEPELNDPSLTTAEQRHIARVREFIRQIVVAKQYGADGVFVPNPFSGWNGVMTEEGKPGELLLPWRTAATLLGGAEYMGQLRLPSGSKNWLFLRPNGQVVMVVWGEHPTEETLYLGDDIKHIDVWGKQHSPAKNGHRDVIKVDRMPSFVLGLKEAVARWRMAVNFENDRVPSIFGQEHANSLMMRNGFKQGVGGKVAIFVPDQLHSQKSSRPKPSEHWKISTPGEGFHGGAGEIIRWPIEINLSDAAVGAQPIRIDFEIDADRVEDSYKFSVWRTLYVGVGDVKINVTTELNKEGRLLVHQQMRNDSGKPINFKCYLNSVGRKRKRAQVFELGPEPDEKTYTFSRGEELVDTKMWIRAEEIDGPLILIERFVAEQ